MVKSVPFTNPVGASCALEDRKWLNAPAVELAHCSTGNAPVYVQAEDTGCCSTAILDVNAQALHIDSATTPDSTPSNQASTLSLDSKDARQRLPNPYN